MINLRPGQKEIAEYQGGYLSVSAVPGAGKTTILAYLAAELISQGYVDNSKILIVTYMNSAVYNFRKKINDFLDRSGYLNANFEVKTIHSLAHGIINERPDEILVTGDFEVIDDGEQGRILNQILNGLDLSRGELLQYLDYQEGDYGYDKAVKKWLGNDLPGFIKSMISDFKYKDISLEQAGKLLQNCSQKDQYLYWSLLTYIDYQKYLNRAGMLDYTDLIVKASKLLDKDAELLGRLQSKYKYIFEDEAQDSNLVQNRILLKLAADTRNLIKVGDPNQSIMSTFTLADPGVFRKYNNKDQVQVNYMLESSRSTEEIIELANYFVKWIVEEFPAASCRQALEEKYIRPVYEDGQLVNPETEGYTIAAYTFKDSEEELDKIVGQAIRQTENNSDRTLAILVPYNYMLVKIADKLKSKGVEYQNTGSYIGEEILVIEKFHRLLNFIASPQSEIYLIELVYNFFLPEYVAGDAQWIQNSPGNRKAQADRSQKQVNKVQGQDIKAQANNDYAGKGQGNSSKESQVQEDRIKEFFKEHQPEEILYPLGGDGVLDRELKGLNSSSREFLKEIIRLLKTWLKASQALPPDELVLMLAEDLELGGEELALAQNIALHFKAELNKRPGIKLAELLEDFNQFTDQYQQFAKKIADRKGFNPEEGMITISTLHQAKGLEWDTVFITGLTAENFPASFTGSFRSEYYYLKDKASNPVALARASLEEYLNDKEKGDPLKEAKIDIISEKLRLLYVGITRAKSNLLLTSHKKIIYDSGYTRDVRPALAFEALRRHIKEAGERDG